MGLRNNQAANIESTFGQPNFSLILQKLGH